MTTGFFQFFNNKVQRVQDRMNAMKKARGGCDHSPLKPRRLLTETLEERQLLAVDVLGASDAILAASATANYVNLASDEISIDAIKQAIANAASTPEDDVIYIPAGNLTFTSASDEIVIDVNSAQSGSISLIGVGDVNIDANDLARVFTIKNGDVYLQSINVSNGVADYGGAIANGGTLTLVDVVLTDNVATVSGGAIASKGTLFVQDSVISDNTSAIDGAAIYEGDFEWPGVVTPEWSDIPDFAGETGKTLNIDLSKYANEGDWTYGFSCSDPNAAIFTTAPVLNNGVLTLNFVGQDDYDAEDNYSGVQFTVTASDGTTTASQTFNVAHERQTSVTVAALLSNMSLDELKESEYAQTHKSGKKVVLDGYASFDGIPAATVVDASSDELYVQVWAEDFCYSDEDFEALSWDAGSYVITGYRYRLHLTNATLVESYDASEFVRDAYVITGEGSDYTVSIGYTSGAPFGYDDALLLDMIKIAAIDPAQPVSVEVTQLGTDFTNPTMVRLYDEPVTDDGRTYTKVDPSQILFEGTISNSDVPIAKPGQPYDTGFSAVSLETALPTGANATYSLVISNSAIVGNNSASGKGAIYVAADGQAEIYNATIADNDVADAVVYAAGNVNVWNSIVVNPGVAPRTANVAGSNNLADVAWSGNVVYDAAKPLFAATGDYSLATDSQALNIGNDSYAIDFNGALLTTDLAGKARFSATVDAGAYEYQGAKPDALTDLAISDYVASSKKPVLTWSVPGSVDGVDGYYVYYYGDTVQLLDTLAGDVTSYSVTNKVALADNQNYRFGVVAFNTYGESTAVSVVLNTTVAPVAPTGLQVSDYVAHSAVLTWNAVSNADYYRIEVQNGSKWDLVADNVTDDYYQLTGLNDFSTYTYRVVAVNVRGEAASDSVTLDTTVTPAVPTNLALAKKYDGDGTATLVWTDVPNAEGYYVAQKIDGKWSVIDKVDAVTFTVDGLADNEQYEFGVASYATKDGVDLVSDYAGIVVYTTVAPAAPENLVWSVKYSSGVAQLQWDAVEAAVGYRVAILTDGAWNVVGDTLGTQFILTGENAGLVDNQEYTVGVSAYTQLGDERFYSDFSTIGLNTIVAPAAPTNLYATYVGGETATLNWNASVGGATGYVVETKVNDQWTVVDTTSATTLDVAVEENSFYVYRVTAFNTVGEETKVSVASDTANLDTLVPPKGEIVVSVTNYSYTDGSANLVWNPLEYAGYYIVEQMAPGETSYVEIATVVSGEGDVVEYALSGLIPNSTYQYRITAYNAKGAGSVGESGAFFTAAPPAVPTTDYVYDSTTASATIFFDSEFADTYVVSAWDGSAWNVVYEGAEGSYVATDLEENETYLFNVVASNNVGSSSPVTVTVVTSAVPHVPTLAAGDYADGSVVLTWNDVAAETGYRVYHFTSDGWKLDAELAADSTSCNVNGLVDYSAYSFAVTAFNAEGESARSNIVVVDTTVAPNAPARLDVTFGSHQTYQGDGKATLIWTEVEHADGYTISQKNEDGSWTVVASTTANTYDLTGLENYKTYEYAVAAYATRGSERLTSDSVSTTFDTAWVPTDSIVVSWDGSAINWNEVAQATGYRVEQMVNYDWVLVDTTTALSFVPETEDNTSYKFRVTAFNAIGSGSSDIVEFFTYAAPATPSDAAFGAYDPATSQATLSWSPVPWANGYSVEKYDADMEQWISVSLDDPAATEYVATGLVQFETYDYRVAAYNNYGVSDWTYVSYYVSTAPAAPTNLNAKFLRASMSADLTWNLSKGADGYHVYQVLDGGWKQIANLSSMSQAYVVSNLQKFQEYTFGISAYNANGESQIAQFNTIIATIKPATPTGVTFTNAKTYAGDGVAYMVWNASEGATEYVISVREGEGYRVIGTTTDTTYTIEGLENNVVYQFALVARNVAGDSDEVHVNFDTKVAPTEDLTLSITPYDYNANVATLSWNSVGGAEGYRVEQNLNGEWSVVADLGAGANSYVLSLMDNTTYDFKVVAFNSKGDGSFGLVESYFTAAPPVAPIDAAFGEFVAETGKATLAWSEVSYADWYDLAQLVDGEWVAISRAYPSEIAYTAEGLEENNEYLFRVRACNSVGVSAWVEVPLSTYVKSAPKAPSDLVVAKYDEASSTVTLNWQDNSGNENGFHVQYSRNEILWTDWATLQANTVSCDVANLERGVTYYFRVNAFNQYGESEWISGSFDVPTGLPTAPSDMQFGEYDKLTASVEMSWVDNSDNENGFRVEYSFNNVDWILSENVGADVTSRIATSLIEGQTYYFRVAAYNSIGYSDWTYGSFYVPHTDVDRPAAPSNIVFGDYDSESHTVSMQWDDNSDNEARFIVQFSYDNETWRGAGTTDADVNYRQATGLVEGRTYYFRVAAYNSAGLSDWTCSEFTPVKEKLAAPSDFSFGEYYNGTLETAWNYSGELDPVDGGFVVQYSYDGQNWQRAGHTAADVTERVAFSVVPNRTYYFRVAAYNGSDYSDWLYSDAYTTPSGEPIAPTDLTFSELSSDRSVVLSWTDMSNVEVGFNVQYSVDGGNTWISSGNTAANISTKVATNLRSGVNYQFRVRAYNYYGASEWIQAEFQVPEVPTPSAPTNVTFGAYDPVAKTLGMSWTDTSDNEYGFRVQYTYDGGANWYAAGNYGANVTSRVATGLVSGRVYQFRVASYNADGVSDWAYSETFTVSDVVDIPSAPTGLTGSYNAESKTVSLNWVDNSSNEKGFKVEYVADGTKWSDFAQVDANTTSLSAADLAQGKTYQFRVAAYNSFGVSEYSNAISVEVASSEAVDVPVFDGYSYSAKKRQIAVVWTGSAETYNIQYSVDPNGEWYSLEANGNSATLQNASYGAVYYFRVQAVNSEGALSGWNVGWFDTTSGESGSSSASLDAWNSYAADEFEDSLDLLANSLLDDATSVDKFFEDFIDD